MAIINRLDAGTWPIGWEPSNARDWRDLGSFLREARSSATDLRNLLESAKARARRLWEESEEKSEESFADNLQSVLEDMATVAGTIEEWLDAAPLDGEKDPFAYEWVWELELS